MREPCYVRFCGRKIELRDADGIYVLSYQMPCEVVQAQLSGGGDDMRVSITMADGRWEIRNRIGGYVRGGRC